MYDFVLFVETIYDAIITGTMRVENVRHEVCWFILQCPERSDLYLCAQVHRLKFMIRSRTSTSHRSCKYIVCSNVRFYEHNGIIKSDSLRLLKCGHLWHMRCNTWFGNFFVCVIGNWSRVKLVRIVFKIYRTCFPLFPNNNPISALLPVHL